jgi:hypothetical protein
MKEISWHSKLALAHVIDRKAQVGPVAGTTSDAKPTYTVNHESRACKCGLVSRTVRTALILIAKVKYGERVM